MNAAKLLNHKSELDPLLQLIGMIDRGESLKEIPDQDLSDLVEYLAFECRLSSRKCQTLSQRKYLDAVQLERSSRGNTQQN